MVWQNVGKCVLSKILGFFFMNKKTILSVLIAVLGSLVARSHQWFESCDRALSLQIGYPQTITSDGYPSKGFPLYSSCRWVISAPGEYQVQAVCYIELTGPVKPPPSTHVLHTHMWYLERLNCPLAESRVPGAAIFRRHERLRRSQPGHLLLRHADHLCHFGWQPTDAGISGHQQYRTILVPADAHVQLWPHNECTFLFIT